MILWQAGDSIISPIIDQFAREKGLQLIDTSIPNATEEHTWIEQANDLKIRRLKKGEVVLIVLLLTKEYDSENTVIQLRRRLMNHQKHMIGLVYPPNQYVKEGFEHDNEGWVSHATLTSLDNDHILGFLREWYNKIGA